MRVLGEFDSRIGGRDYQEDKVIFLRSPQETSGLAVVSDGVGGHGGGDAASKMVVSTAREAWMSVNGRPSDPKEFLGQIVRVAHARIRDLRSSMPNSDPQATVAMALFANEKVHIVHVGDSRVHLIRRGVIDFVTRDHSVVEGLIYVGEITPEEARKHPSRGQLLQSVGGSRDPKLSYEQRDLMNGDVVLLCTDGVWETIAKNDLVKYSAGRDLGDTARTIASRAEQYGGPQGDNASVVIVRVDQMREDHITPLTRAPSDTAVAAQKIVENIARSAGEELGRVTDKKLMVPALTAVSAVLIGLALGAFWFKPSPPPVAGDSGNTAALEKKADATAAANTTTGKQTAAGEYSKVAELTLSSAIDQLRVAHYTRENTPENWGTVAAIMSDGSAVLYHFDKKSRKLNSGIAAQTISGLRRLNATALDSIGVYFATTMPNAELLLRHVTAQDYAQRFRMPSGFVNGLISDGPSSFVLVSGGKTICLFKEDKRSSQALPFPLTVTALDTRQPPPLPPQANQLVVPQLTVVKNVCDPIAPELPAVCKVRPNAPECRVAAQPIANVAANPRTTRAAPQPAPSTPEGFEIQAIVALLTQHGPATLALLTAGQEVVHIERTPILPGVEGNVPTETLLIKSRVTRQQLETAQIPFDKLTGATLIGVPTRSEEVILFLKDHNIAYRLNLNTAAITPVVLQVEGAKDDITALAARYDGGLVAGTAGGRVRLFNSDGQFVRSFEDPKNYNYITAIGTAVQGREIYVADNKGMLAVWSDEASR